MVSGLGIFRKKSTIFGISVPQDHESAFRSSFRPLVLELLWKKMQTSRYLTKDEATWPTPIFLHQSKEHLWKRMYTKFKEIVII